MIRAHSMSLPHLSADLQRAPLIASKKCSGRHAARLRRDGITVRLSCSFNFLATRVTAGASEGAGGDKLSSITGAICAMARLSSAWGRSCGFGKLIADETEKWAKVVKFGSIKPA